MKNSTKDSVLIKNVLIYDKGSEYHLQRKSIRIEGGIISHIGKRVPKARHLVDGSNWAVSPGWFDFGVYGGEPGYEQRETMHTLAAAAKRGGYTRIAVFPDTNPCIDNASMVDFITAKAIAEDIYIEVIGALTKDMQGKQLAEILDMYQSGAIAFSDAEHSISDDSMMLKALQYASTIPCMVLNRPVSPNLVSGAYINEGVVSTALGLRGEPVVAELIALDRDIRLAGYAETTNYMAHLISSEASAKRIAMAKQKNIRIRCSVSSRHLVATENKLNGYDPNHKLNPPLRTETDRRGLIKACKTGWVDAIVSNHKPIAEEEKKLDFLASKQGSIGLETCFAELITFQDQLDTETIVDYLGRKNRMALNMDVPVIKKNAKAELTFFDPKESWCYDAKHILSASKNTPYINQTLVGRAKALYIKEKWIPLENQNSGI